MSEDHPTGWQCPECGGVWVENGPPEPNEGDPECVPYGWVVMTYVGEVVPASRLAEVEKERDAALAIINGDCPLHGFTASDEEGSTDE